MTSDLDLRGVWVPLITPFDAQGAVDIGAIERLCHEYSAAGVSGIVALGTTGEPVRWNPKRSGLRSKPSSARATTPARAIVGTGSNNTQATIRERGAGRHAVGRGRAGRGSVLRAAVRRGHRRPFQGGRGREPGPGDRVQRPVPDRSRHGCGRTPRDRVGAEHRGREAGGRHARRRHARSPRQRARRLRRARRRGHVAVPAHVHGRGRHDLGRGTCARSASSR